MSLPQREVTELRDAIARHYWEHDHQWDPLTSLPIGETPQIITHGQGARLHTAEGHELVDLVGGMECVNVGYGRKELAEAASRQMIELGYWSALIGASVPAVKLSKLLADLAPGDLNHVFLTSDGSDAVETAIKIARQAQIQRGFPYRGKIISRQYCYHGATAGAMSIEGPQAPITGGKFVDLFKTPGTRQAYQVDCSFCTLDQTYPDCRLLCAENIRHIIEYEGAETVAAVLVDPIAISPRAFVPPDDYLPRIREICDHYGVYLICDEVVNGFGRTGKMFAVEHWDVQPDILCVSKGIASGYMPLAATLATEEVYSHFNGEPSRLFHHGHTYGAHPVASAVAIANIEIIRRESLVEKAAAKGDLFLAGLRKLAKYPIVLDVQGKGLLLGIRLVGDKQSKTAVDPAVSTRIAQLMYQKGFWTMISFICPPLVISEEEIESAVNAFDESIAQACKEYDL